MADNLFIAGYGYSNANLVQQIDIYGNKKWGVGGRYSNRDVCRGVTTPAICKRDAGGVYIATVLESGSNCYVTLDVIGATHSHSGNYVDIVYDTWAAPKQISPNYATTDWTTVPTNVQMVKDSAGNLWIGWTVPVSQYVRDMCVSKYDKDGTLLLDDVLTFRPTTMGTYQSSKYRLSVDVDDNLFIETGWSTASQPCLCIIKINSSGTVLFNIELPVTDVETEATLYLGNVNGCVDNAGGYYVVGKYAKTGTNIIRLHHIDAAGDITSSAHLHEYSDSCKVCKFTSNILVYNAPNVLVLGYYTVDRLLFNNDLEYQSRTSFNLEHVTVFTNPISDNEGGYYIVSCAANSMYLDHTTSTGTQDWSQIRLTPVGETHVPGGGASVISDGRGGIICVWKHTNTFTLTGQRIDKYGRKIWDESLALSTLGSIGTGWDCTLAWGTVVEAIDPDVPDPWPVNDPTGGPTTRTLDIHFSKLHLKQGFN